VTIGTQIHKQWRDGTSKGVSRWLFLGQMAASAGFTLYSWLVHNWVFVVTNALMLLGAIVGYSIVMLHRHREARGSTESEGEARRDTKAHDDRSPVADARVARRPDHGVRRTWV
jgi:hypothetical protein